MFFEKAEVVWSGWILRTETVQEGMNMEMDYVFMTRSYWLEMSIPKVEVQKKYTEYFGRDDSVILDRKDAIVYLSNITGRIQSKLTDYMKSSNTCVLIKDLYKILDKAYHFYFRQKEARNELVKLNIQDGDITDTFEENRNKSRNVIDSVNLWLENCLIFQENIDETYDPTSFELNQELFVEMYIYGLASQALSLISMSQKFGEKELYTGIEIHPNEDTPIEIIKYHPVIYYNTALTGNQNVLNNDTELAKADETDFGQGFKETYKVGFIDSLRIMSTLQKELLRNGQYAMTIINREQFIGEINRYGVVDGEAFFEAFVLTKEKVLSQLKKNDPIIWIMNSNKYRHEIRPFMCLDNDRIYISHCAMEQTKHLWRSIYLNGGMCYSNDKDPLTRAIEKRNEELSDRLVAILRSKLRAHYNATIDEIDVRYDRIFGIKDIDYGDFDLVFYTKDTNELFLIEAKFFSDSLNNSGVISDYEKMFKENGYYEHCRRRYDLVMCEKDKMKSFLEVGSEVKAHFLFVSSKPLEIEFQDSDEIVTFPCLSIFDKYIDGKLLPETGDAPMRPVHIL